MTMPPFDTALYYTFSTISQTLAGALGLLAAFVITRAASLNDLIAERARQVHDSVQSTADAEKAYVDGDLGRYLEITRTRVGKSVGNMPNQRALDGNEERMLAAGEQAYNRRRRLIASTRGALVWSIGAILYSLAGLVATPFLTSFRLVAALLAVLGVFLAAWCLRAYWALLRTVMSEG
jgi:hypothetical protein